MEGTVVTQEDSKPSQDAAAAERQTQPQDEAPLNRAERRAMAQGKKGGKGNAHTVSLPGGQHQGPTRGSVVPPQQHTRSSNRGK
jgi:hypothetical protein